MRVAIVNDLQIAVEILRRALALLPQHELAWIARDGAEALACCMKDTPDLILMDLVMPVMDGVAATRQIMANCPCAIVIVTASIDHNVGLVFEAMGAGALDAVDTPSLGMRGGEQGNASLLAKIEVMSGLLGTSGDSLAAAPSIHASHSNALPPLVVIGASAGGPSALARVLSQLPPGFPAAVAVIQHVDEQFAPALVSWLADQSTLPVRPVSEGDVIKAGQVLVAVKNKHLVLSASRRLAYTEQPLDVFYRPSINLFFDSVLDHWQGDVIGVILTGMGQDGARGLKRLRDAGHHTIAQDEASCAVYGMPKVAAQLGAAVEILPLERIAPTLVRLGRKLSAKKNE
jgi:chemotaxis response regulator CheB